MLRKVMAVPRCLEDLDVISRFLSDAGFEGELKLLIMDFTGIDVESYVAAFNTSVKLEKMPGAEILKVRYDGMTHPVDIIQEVAVKEGCDFILVVSGDGGNLFHLNLAASLASNPTLPLLVIPHE